MSNVETAACTMGSVDGTTKGATYTITFTEWMPHLAENNVYSHDGNPPITDFTCDISGVTSSNSPTCSITDVVNSNVIGMSLETYALFVSR